MKHRDPGFFDYPTIWSAFGSLGLGIVVLIGHTVHGTPYTAQDIYGITGAGLLAWFFAVGRYTLLWPD